MSKKITYEELSMAFQNRGYELLSTEYLGIDKKLKYICPKHRGMGEQEIDYSHLKRGQGCKYCGKENKRSGRQKDLEDYHAKELTESKGMEFVEITREDSILYVYYICPHHKDKGVQKTTLESMRRKKIGCPYCIGRGKTTEDFKLELYAINPNVLVLGEYIDAKTGILCECLIDGTRWNPVPNALLSGQGCPECGRIASNLNSMKTNEEFLHELSLITTTINPLELYKGVKEKIWVQCLMCKHQWLVTPDELLHGECGCPRCSASKNERRLMKIFESLNINFQWQHKYVDCRDVLPLPFDFYLSDYNIIIEYDGEHHYFPIPRGNMTQEEAYEQLLITQKHDKTKTMYCETHNIPLIRIPYWESNNLQPFFLEEMKKLNIHIANN